MVDQFHMRRISEVVSAAQINQVWIRFVIRDLDGTVGSYWVSRDIFEAHLSQFGSNEFVKAAGASIEACLETSEFFAAFEAEFTTLIEYVDRFGLGYVADMRRPAEFGESVEVIFTVDGPRLCLHAISPDGMTRLFLAKADGNSTGGMSAIDWRLEYCPSNDDEIAVVRQGTWLEDELDEDARPLLFDWALSCLTGPLTPAPLAS